MVLLSSGIQQTGKTNIARIKDNFSRYIVRPANLFGLGGFAFDIERNTSISLQVDITDHYVEDNTSVQDHAAVRPLRITLRNYVGELVHEGDNNNILNSVNEVVRKLTVIDAYVPVLSTQANQVKNIIKDKSARDFDTLTENSLNLFALTRNLNPAATKQQQAYLYFEALAQQKIPVSVQTPFKFLTNMYIESITATQGQDSSFISDFEITLKQVRQTSFQTVPFNSDNFQSRTAQQREPETEKGNAQGEVKDISAAALLVDTVLGR